MVRIVNAKQFYGNTNAIIANIGNLWVKATRVKPVLRVAATCGQQLKIDPIFRKIKILAFINVCFDKVLV